MFLRRLTDLPTEVLRALLLPEALPAVGTGGDAVPAFLAEVDWAALRRDAGGHALGIQVFRRLEELGWTGAVDPSTTDLWRADVRHAELQYRLQKADLDEVCALLRRHGVRHAVIKGTGYRETLYAPAWIRLCGDADLLVDGARLEDVRRLMLRAGFQHAACTLDYDGFRPARRDEIMSTEAQHYELAQLVRSHRLLNAPAWLLGPGFERRAPFTYERVGSDVLFRSVVDVHWAIHFSLAGERPLDDVVEDGTAPPVLAPGWCLFVSAFKLYYEAFDRPGYGLHHLVDIAALLRAGLAPEEWDRVADLTARHGREAALFYTLGAAEALIGEAAVPPELVEAWAQGAGGEGDLGDFVPSMLARRVPSGFLRALRPIEPSPLPIDAAPEADATRASRTSHVAA